MKEKTPLYAAILIGGKSRRMGRPKHLIHTDSTTWLERTVKLLAPLTKRIVLVGEGDVPASCCSLLRLADIGETAGPLAGIVAAMRFAPQVDWLIIACDMPAITSDSLHWLLQGRETMYFGRVPRLDETKEFYEPLFALYKSSAAALFETLLQKGKTKIGLVARFAEIETPVVPTALHNSWRNINTPEELRLFQR